MDDPEFKVLHKLVELSDRGRLVVDGVRTLTLAKALDQEINEVHAILIGLARRHLVVVNADGPVLWYPTIYGANVVSA